MANSKFKKPSSKQLTSAFSMLELSIVILVISVMIVGITTSKSMFRKAILANAQSLTQKSIVNNLSDDVVMWLETSLESSFLESEIKNDQSYITIWKDNNKNTLNKNNATAATPLSTANQPQLYQNAFYDSIPGLRFSGAQYLNFNGNSLVKSSYTVFVVEQRTATGTNKFFIAGGDSAINSNLTLGYRSSTVSTQAHWGGNDIDATVPAYKAQTPTIHTFLFNNNLGKSYSINGILKASSAQLSSLNSYNNARIGFTSPIPTYYNGDIAEIIIFRKSLKKTEIKAIENYLGSKYGIAVS